MKYVCRLACVGGIALALSLAAPAARAQEAQGRGLAAEAGLGVGSAVINMVYGPVKVIYAALGTVTAGIAYLCTGLDGEVGSKIMYRSVGGDYAITPEILTGEKVWTFTGPDAQPTQQETTW
jgi:hypothetical protein